MAILEEKEPGLLAAVLIPLIAFVLIFPLWHLGERDLYWTEGEYAAVAHEMNSIPPVATAHGELAPDIYPLFPFSVSQLHKATGWSIEFCLRFLSVLFLGGLAALVWESCRRTLGLQAAAVGAAAMISTVLVAEKGIDGYPHMMALFFVAAGWLTWFTFGQSRGDWDMAWISGGLFCGLAFYCNGWESLFFFIAPLLFMRRPLSIWSRLNRPGFYIGLGIVVCFVLLWAIPRWNAGLAGSLRSALPLDSRLSFSDYVGQLFAFPFEVLLRFLPWTLFIWAPFCAAIVPLDRNPLFSRFLKTIFVTILAFLWLFPTTNGRDILFLAPSFSILVALHYWIVARRHGDAILLILKAASALLAVAGLLCLLFYLAPLDSLRGVLPMVDRGLAYKSVPSVMIRGLVESILVMLGAGLAFWLCRTRSKVWCSILALFVSGMMLFWAVANPYKASDTSKSDLGRKLRAALGPAASPSLLVYKDSAISGLFSECEYMDCKVKRISSAADLPPKAKEVYVIALEVPSVPERTWTNLLPPEERYKDKRLCLWKGVLKDDRRPDVQR